MQAVHTNIGIVIFYIQTNYFIATKKIFIESTQTGPLRKKGGLFLLAPGSSQSEDRLSALSLISNKKNLMINLKNYIKQLSMNFADNKIKYSKMKGYFLDRILWLTSHRPPLIGTHNLETDKLIVY